MSATRKYLVFLCTSSLLFGSILSLEPAMARDFKTKDEIERVLSTPVPLSKAISIAAKHSKGRVISAEIEDSIPMVAEIKITTPDGATKVVVNLHQGTIVNESEPLLASKAFKYSRKHEALEHAKLTLQEAIHLAEEKTGGRVVKAKFTSDNGVYVYDLESVETNSYTDIRIDANTKEILTSDYRRAK